MSNEFFVSKSYICYGKASFREIVFYRFSVGLTTKKSLNTVEGEGLGSGLFPFSISEGVSQTKTFFFITEVCLDLQDLPFLQML